MIYVLCWLEVNEKKRETKTLTAMKKRYWIPLLVLILVIVLWLILPTLIENKINSVLADIDGYRGSITNVDLNLIEGAYTVDSLVIDLIDGDDRYPFVAVDQINLSIDWGALFNASIVGDVELLSPNVHLMAETPITAAQYGDDVNWRKHFQELMTIQINTFTVRDGKVHYMDMGAKPVVDLPVSNIDLEILNITNVEESAEELPSRIKMTAVSIGDGEINLEASANFLSEVPELDLVFEFENVNLPQLNDFFEAYAAIDIEEGEFSLYSEFAVNDGLIEGYLQPIILDLKIVDLDDEDHDFFSAAWEVIVGGVSQIFRNQSKDQLATRVPISGEIKDPEAGVYKTIWNILRNAFIESFSQSVEGLVDFESLEQENGESE